MPNFRMPMVEGVHRSCAEVVDRTHNFELTLFEVRRQDGLKLPAAFNAKCHVLTNGVFERDARFSVTLGDGRLD